MSFDNNLFDYVIEEHKTNDSRLEHNWDAINGFTYSETDSHENMLSNVRNSIHYFIYNSSETIDVQKADTICRQRNLRLLTVHNKNVDNYLVDVLTKSSPQLFWIRLSNLLKINSHYHWSERSAKDFSSFQNKGLNKRDAIRCVTIDRETGAWNQTNCNDSAFGFMCSPSGPQSPYNLRRRIKKIANIFGSTEWSAQPVAPQPTPSKCNISGLKWDDSIKYGDSCYLFMTQTPLSWTEAQEECQRMSGSNLTSIVELSEYDFITNKRTVNLTFWAPKQPNLMSKGLDNTCVFMDTESGEWSLSLCSEKRSFICKTSEVHSTPKHKDHYQHVCPELTEEQSWSNLDRDSEYCYLFSSDFEPNLLKTTWSEASEKCRSLNSTLLSLHSYHLNSMFKMRDRIRDNTWIGLHETEHGYYEWDDKSALDFTNWDNEANGINSDKKCVSIRPSDLKWTLNPCFDTSYVYDFICATRKLQLIGVRTELTPIITSTESDAHALGVDDSDWDTAKVIKLCFIIIGAVIGVSICVNLYFVWKRGTLRNWMNRNRNMNSIEQNGSSSSGSSQQSIDSYSEAMERRRRFNDVLNSSDPNVVFIWLHFLIQSCREDKVCDDQLSRAVLQYLMTGIGVVALVFSSATDSIWRDFDILDLFLNDTLQCITDKTARLRVKNGDKSVGDGVHKRGQDRKA
ncbi:unnamed protein product [Oppiella nova]|uniref:C-type lectin domain-containing protein n=1 Tax=Oppiella nova TaxID=334625 RepID=A0A7R9M6R9_9ACAR|nr:unnamed protein product [Oppiella nova]CAG2171699.1 unnamed protein product [Oppiella nova]